jgi:hypothetical protein
MEAKFSRIQVYLKRFLLQYLQLLESISLSQNSLCIFNFEWFVN